MKGLLRLKEEVHNRVLILRTIENIILRPKFARLWYDSSESEKEEVIKIIEESNRSKLYEWVRKHHSLDLGEKPVKQLRDIAKRSGIKYYAKLTHAQLIAEIIEKETEI
jgi:hypothetical protein